MKISSLSNILLSLFCLKIITAAHCLYLSTKDVEDSEDCGEYVKVEEIKIYYSDKTKEELTIDDDNVIIDENFDTSNLFAHDICVIKADSIPANLQQLHTNFRIGPRPGASHILIGIDKQEHGFRSHRNFQDSSRKMALDKLTVDYCRGPDQLTSICTVSKDASVADPGDSGEFF